MGELLKAAVGCIEAPSLFPRELKILMQVALLADDTTGPTLTPTGTVLPPEDLAAIATLSLIHISEPTRRHHVSRMPSSA